MATLYSAAGKKRSEALLRECVEYLAHYSLSKTHTGCTVAYDKDSQTISICETETAASATSDNESSYTTVSFRGTGLNDWYRALNRAGYRTFVGEHELVWTYTHKEDPRAEEIWHHLNPPLHTQRSSSETATDSSEQEQTSTGAITFMGKNTSCTFRIEVSYKGTSE